MNILIVTAYFYPENFRINDLVLELQKKGHNINVLTSIPNYPEGHFFSGYGCKEQRNECYRGINIHRCFTWPRRNSSNINLFLNYFFYVLFASKDILKFRKKKIDVIFVYEPSPVTVCIPAIVLKKLKNIPICFWVLDLWPESLSSSERVKSSFLMGLINPLVKFIYKNCDKILVSSKGFTKSIINKSVSHRKISYFPQWAEDIFAPKIKVEGELAKMPSGFNIMFAGNIGSGQDFDSLVKAVLFLGEKSKINWIIVGKGSKYRFLKGQIKKNNLQNKIYLLGSFDLSQMPQLYLQADAMFISLSKKYIYSITVPAKLQSYMACGKPVLSMIDGETSAIINEADAGLTSSAGDFKKLAENALKMSKMEKRQLVKLGENSRKYYLNHFNKSNLIDVLENTLHSLSKTNT